MAAAVIITVPAWLWLRETWNDVGCAMLSEEQYEGLIVQHTSPSSSAQSYSADTAGSGWWRSNYNQFIASAALASGTADHLYLLFPDGSVRASTVVRTVKSMDAPTGNETGELLDASEDFTAATAVAENDLVVFGATGATAKVTGIAATVLTTTAPTMNQIYAASKTYYVVRPPGTDTTATLNLTGRPLDWRQAQRCIGERLLQQATTQRAAGYGGASATPPEVAAIRQRLAEIRGVRGR